MVDTHVQRPAQRLGWSKNADPAKIEQDLCAELPRDKWDLTGHVLIFHGRRCCFARKPECRACSVSDVCPCAFDAEDVGAQVLVASAGCPAKLGLMQPATPCARS